MMDFSDSDDTRWKAPMVVSSFFRAPESTDNRSSVRMYEITNANNEIKKLHKGSLEELRFEHLFSDAMYNFVGFFKNRKAAVNGVNYAKKVELEVKDDMKKEDIQAAKQVVYHTRPDGNLMTVTSYDVSKPHGTELALQDFVVRKSVMKDAVEKNNVLQKRDFYTAKWVKDNDESVSPHGSRHSKQKSSDHGRSSRHHRHHSHHGNHGHHGKHRSKSRQRDEYDMRKDLLDFKDYSYNLKKM